MIKCKQAYDGINCNINLNIDIRKNPLNELFYATNANYAKFDLQFLVIFSVI